MRKVTWWWLATEGWPLSADLGAAYLCSAPGYHDELRNAGDMARAPCRRLEKADSVSPLSPFHRHFRHDTTRLQSWPNAPARLFKAADDDAMLTCLYSRVAHPCSVNRYQYLYFSLELRNPSSYTSTRYRGDGEPHLLEQLKNLRPCRSLSRYIISLQRHMASTRSMATLSWYPRRPACLTTPRRSCRVHLITFTVAPSPFVIAFRWCMLRWKSKASNWMVSGLRKREMRKWR